MGSPKVFHSSDGLWIEADVQETKGGRAGTVVTGGIHDIRSTAVKAILLRLRSQPDADPKKLTQSAREFVISFSGHSPLVMPPTFASGWIDFRFEGELAMDVNSLMDGLSAHFAGTEIAKSTEHVIDGRSLGKKQMPDSELLSLGRERADIDAEKFTSQQVANLFDEIESDYAEFLHQTLGLAFKRRETSRRFVLEAHWETSYAGNDVRKLRTADLSLAAHRASRRVEHMVDDSPGLMGRITGKKPTSRKVSELELTSDFDSVRVLLVAGSYMERAQSDIAGRILTGGMKDIAMKSAGSTAAGGQNVLVDLEIKPKTLSRLDSVVKDALAGLYRQSNVTYGAT